MQQSYTIRVDPAFKREFEGFVRRSRMYSSVSEAVKEAMRDKALELHMREMDGASKRLAAKMKADGVTLKDLERAMFDKDYRDKLAEEFDKEKGFKRTRLARPRG